MNASVIVSRHKAAIEFIATQLGGTVGPQHECVYITDDMRCECCNEPQGYCQKGNDFVGTITREVIPVIASATVADVKDKIVYGNLPLNLACHASEIVAVEFHGIPPRGQEYTLADMVAARAKLARYKVFTN
jgi:hypothetical protein